MRAALGTLFLSLCSVRAAAQSIATPLEQWQHTSWTGANGPPVPIGVGLAQSNDGYLWIGARQGLLRFDGVRFTLIDQKTVPALRDGGALGFVPWPVDRNGRMWVSGPRGLLLSYKDGQFEQARGRTESQQVAVKFAGDGRMWLHGPRLELFQNGTSVRAPLPSSVPDSNVFGLEADNGTGVWIGTHTDGVWHVVGDSVEHFGKGRQRVLLQERSGAIWLLTNSIPGQLQRIHGDTVTDIRLPENDRSVFARSALEGPDGSVWLPLSRDGVMRWRNGTFERFSKSDGLSDDDIRSLFVSREGALWVTTETGLDRLRPGPFATLRTMNNAPTTSQSSFVFDLSGALWTVDESNAVLRHTGGLLDRSAASIRTTRVQAGGREDIRLLSAARDGGVWLRDWHGTLMHVTAQNSRRYGANVGLPGVPISEILETSNGTIWIDHLFGGGFGRLRDGRYKRIALPDPYPIREFWQDAHERLWLVQGDRKQLTIIEHDSIVSHVDLPGANPTLISTLVPENADTLWALGNDGLYRVTAGRAEYLNVPELTDLLQGFAHGVVARGQLWLASTVGVARLSLSELHAAVDRRSARPSVVRFDALDGFVVPRARSTATPMRVAPDGRVWIDTPSGLVMALDTPAARNTVAPRAIIEAVVVGATAVRISNHLTIAPNPGRLEIHFTAPSLGLAERMRLEYRLDGADSDWTLSTGPRVAYYGQLRPGTYRFRVRAWNEDGVPGANEATLDFRVQAAWYEQWWFLAMCMLAAIGASTGAALLIQRERNRRTAAIVSSRFQAVLAERSRLARELHDTLLQGFTGITLKIDGVRNRLESQENANAEELSQILNVADRSLREAREMVWEMREPTTVSFDLASRMEDQLRALPNLNEVELSFAEMGARREVAPEVAVPMLRISREAVSNALRHASPKRVDVQLTYGQTAVTLDVRDDGRGTDPESVDRAMLRGHWGIAGMKERVRIAGGSFTLTTSPGRGLSIQVTIPLAAEST